MIRSLILAPLAVLSSYLPTQAIEIKVVDHETGLAIPGAKICINVPAAECPNVLRCQKDGKDVDSCSGSTDRAGVYSTRIVNRNAAVRVRVTVAGYDVIEECVNPFGERTFRLKKCPFQEECRCRSRIQPEGPVHTGGEQLYYGELRRSSPAAALARRSRPVPEGSAADELDLGFTTAECERRSGLRSSILLGEPRGVRVRVRAGIGSVVANRRHDDRANDGPSTKLIARADGDQ